MRQKIRFLTRTLGRRETLKYLSIATIGAAISPLTGCSGTILAFKKFGVGKWGISFDDSTDWSDAILTVGEGTWELKAGKEDMSDRAGHGVWSMSGTSVTVEEEGEDRYFVHDYHDVASGIPKELNTEDMPESFTWTHGTDEGEETATRFKFSVQWDQEEQVLTLRRAETPSRDPFSLTAKRHRK